MLELLRLSKGFFRKQGYLNRHLLWYLSNPYAFV